MYETEIWRQNIAKTVLENNAMIAVLASLLVDKGISTFDELKKLREEILTMEPYVGEIKKIEDNLAQYEKWKNADQGKRSMFMRW